MRRICLIVFGIIGRAAMTGPAIADNFLGMNCPEHWESAGLGPKWIPRRGRWADTQGGGPREAKAIQLAYSPSRHSGAKGKTGVQLAIRPSA